MGARKNETIVCSGCGAEVRFGPASCPLCGKFVGNPPPAEHETGKPVEDYQEDLRRLRAELDKLRKEIA